LARVVWSDEAYDDLDKLFSYLAPRDQHAAERYCGEMERSALKLAEFPEMGRKYVSRYRVLIFRNHLIFYRHEAQTGLVTITTVLDGRRDIEALLPKEQ